MKIRTSIKDINFDYFIKNNVFDNESKNRIYDWEDFFRSRLLVNLNELFGDDWKLDFTQESEKSWLVDIEAKDMVTVKSIKSVINQKLEGFEVEAFCNGRGI